MIDTGISLSIVFGIPATATFRPRFLISCNKKIKGNEDEMVTLKNKNIYSKVDIVKHIRFCKIVYAGKWH